MARATKEVKQEIDAWVKNVKTEAEKYDDLEHRLWKLSSRALIELARSNEEALMKFFATGTQIPDYINHFVLRVKFEIKDRKEKKTWNSENK